MGIIAWIILGLAAGAIAKALYRGGYEPSGALATLVVGIVGALVGGFIAVVIGAGSIGSVFSVGTWLMAIGSAFLVLAIYNAVMAGRKLPRSA